MKTPIDLKLDGKTVAKILSFSYETPWATGKVEFEDHSLFKKMVAVSSLSSFSLEVDELDLEDDEEEEMWQTKLSELGIMWEDLNLNCDDRWSVTPSGGKSQPIYALQLYESGFVEWRL